MSDLGNKAIMSKNIRYYMALHDKTRAELSRDLGIKYTTLTDWINGKTYPRIDKIEMMARYFGIEKSDLVESKTVASQKVSLSEDEADLLAIYSKLNTSGREKAKGYINDLTRIEKYTEKEEPSRGFA